MYKEVSDVLLRTRKKLTEVCNQLSINPENIDIDKLSVSSCDNCGWWGSHKSMIIIEDGTIYCTVCDDMETIRF